MILNSGLKLTELPKHLKLVAVTKGRSVDAILKLLNSTGLKRVGENRLKEAIEKFEQLPSEIEKHFIGKLQSRKIPEIVEHFDVIQSLENLKQAELISKQGKSIEVMLQVNISKLPNRSGCKVDETESLIQAIKSLPNLKLIGVMGIATHDLEKSKEEFALLKSLQGELEECSMGMSEDYKEAIEAGSTMLRLGRILFDF